MKGKSAFFGMVLMLVAGFGAGWYGARHGFPLGASAGHAHGGEPEATARRLKYYQSPMHPWIRSSKAGNCTICGMKLVPVYEGDGEMPQQGDAVGVALSKSVIQTVGVETESVQRRALRRTLRVAGTIDDDDTRHRKISAYTEGRVEKLFVSAVGTHVREGQPLVRVFSPAIAGARQEYLSLARQLPSPQREKLVMAARERLVRMGLSASQIDVLEGSSDQSAAFDLASPMGGTVITRGVYEGQYVKEGDVLFEIGDFAKMWFVAEVYERDLGEVRVGQRVEVRSPAVPGQVLEARVDFIDPNLMPETRTARVRVVLENPEREGGGRMLLHKSLGQALIHLDAPEVLAIPASALLNPGGQPFVYVESAPGAYEQREVKLGRSGESFREVLEGVELGERVVTHGALLIDSQARMETKPSATH